MTHSRQDETQNAPQITLNAAIARELRRRRRAAKLTIRELSERTGIAATTLSQLENDKQNVTPRFLEQLAQFYGCMPRDLMPGSPVQAQLVAAVEARDVDQVVEVLRGLGIEVSARPSSDPRYAVVESDRRDIAIDQVLHATRTIQSVLRGLSWAEDALTPRPRPTHARRLFTLEIQPTADDVLRELADWAAESRATDAVNNWEKGRLRVLEKAARDLLLGPEASEVARARAYRRRAPKANNEEE